MKKWQKNALVASGVAVGAAAAASLTAYITTRCLVNTALDREPPRVMKKAEGLLAGVQQIDPRFLDAVEEASARLAAQPNEEVHITARDGTPLVGHFFPVEHPQRIIVAVHGWRSSWHRDFGMVSDFWRANDCAVLYIEQRGQNKSGGAYMGFGLIERYDCLDWIHWLQAHCGAEVPMYLSGVSMGATTVLMAAGLELPACVRGISADCGFTAPQAIWKHVAEKNLHMAYGLYGSLADMLCRRKIQMGAGAYSTVTALQRATVPVLFVHGTADHFVPIEMTYENYAACASEKRLLVVPEADHGMSYFLEPARYEATVHEFWRLCEGADAQTAEN